MKTIITITLLAISSVLMAQKVSTFEELNVPQDSFFNNANGEDWKSGDFTLPNTYSLESWGESWSGWAVSTKKDTQTAGFTNQFSAYTGGGYDGSETYAVGFGNHNIRANNLGDLLISGFYITNSTYAYLSMKEGDQFAKKFGGEDGSDPDFFKVTIKGMKDGTVKDTLDFYLADFRFEDNSKDYIIDQWTWVDLAFMGAGLDSLTFTYASSDVGNFGINTPKYICVDNITTNLHTSTDEIDADIAIFPNPTASYIQISGVVYDTYSLYTLEGKCVAQGQYAKHISIAHIESGNYVLALHKGRRTSTRMITKL